jgi:Fe-S cluster assembly scaffold protein SufB
LRSRGLGADQAAHLLLEGFCDQILASLPKSTSCWEPAAALLRTARPR